MSVLTKVLVLDDEQDDFLQLRSLFRSRRTLSSRHFYLEHAKTPAEARARLDVDHWNFLIVDFHLGGQESGLDFVLSLHDSGRPYPVLLLSGATDIPVDPRTVELVERDQLHFLSKDDLSWGSLQHAIADKISRTFRVLIVDDDRDDILMFRDRLKDSELIQFDVDEARNLAEARNLLRRSTYDVLLLDFRLDGDRGTNLLFDTPQDSLPESIILCTGMEHFELDHRTLQLISHGRLRFFSKTSLLHAEALTDAILGASRLVLWSDSVLFAGDNAANMPASRPAPVSSIRPDA